MKNCNSLCWIGSLYAASLPLTAVPGPCGHDGPLGITCLVAVPFVFFHPSWWANPLFFYGCYSLHVGEGRRALICGLVASTLAVGFGVSFPSREIAAGYAFWTASMIGLTWSAGVDLDRKDRPFESAKVDEFDDF